jgi:hypothetical protein
MPTFVHGKNTRVLIGERDLSSSFKEFTAGANIDMAETSAFGNVNKTYVQGLADSTIGLNGMFSGGVDEIDEALNELLGSIANTPVIVAPNGYGIGKSAFGLGAQQSSYEITGSIGDVVAVSTQFQSKVDSGGRSGKLLTPGTSATGNQTSVDNGAATTNGGYALLSVTETAGGATVTVQDSADNTAWATIATFAAAGAGTPTSEYVAITGTIRRYTRAVITGTAIAHVLIVRH